MNCIIYARVSSKEQEREGHSIPAQLDLMREYAKRQGFQIVQEFTEVETAKRSGREQFTNIIKLLKQKTAPKIVLVEKTDRLYRNFKDYSLVEDLMNDHGISIHLVKEGEILSKDAQSHVKFIHGIKTLMAKNYIDNLTEEIKKGRLQKIKDGGWPCSSPYGYKMVNGQLTPEEGEADFVRAAFQLYATGLYSLRSCAKTLKEQGFVYRPGRPTILSAELDRVLKRRAYIGQMEFKGQIYQGKHEPLIDLQTWNQVQVAFKKDGKPLENATHHFRYKGLFTCGSCGCLLTGDAKKGGKYIYYRCANAIRKQGCEEKYINQDVIDAEITRLFYSITFDDSLKTSILEAILQMNALKAQEEEREHQRIAKLNAKIKTIRTKRRVAYEDRLSGVIDEELWSSLSEDMQNQIDNLESQIAGIGKADIDYYKTASRMFELPERLTRGWSSALEEEKVVLLNFVSSNSFVKNGTVTMSLFPPFRWMAETRKENLVETEIQYSNLFEILSVHHKSIDIFWHKLAA